MQGFLYCGCVTYLGARATKLSAALAKNKTLSVTSQLKITLLDARKRGKDRRNKNPDFYFWPTGVRLGRAVT